MKTSKTQIARRSALTGAVAVLGMSIASLMADSAPTTAPTTKPTAALAPTTAPVVAPMALDLSKLINQLGSDDADDRDMAQKKLVALGKSAVPALKKAADTSDDPEIRSRAAAALSQMKEHDQNDVSLITLHMKDASATDVLNAISAQSQAQISTLAFGRAGAAAENRTLTIDADQKPFWDVMTDVCTQLNLCPTLELAAKNQMRLQPLTRSWMQSPHQISGAFFIGAAGVYRTRTIDLQGPPIIDDQFSVRLVVCPEPKLAVVQISDLVLKEAKDDLGHSLIPKAQPARAAQMMMLRSGVSSFSQNSRTIESRLQYPAEQPGTKIALLSGEIKVMVAQDIQQYIVDDVMGTQKITSPLKNCSVQVTVSKQGIASSDTYLVTVEATREGLSDDQWAALVSRTNDITVEDADGHALSSLTYAIGGQSTETTYSCRAFFTRNTALGIANRQVMIGGMNGAAGAIQIGGAGAVAVVGGAANAAAVKVGEPKRVTWNVATALKTLKVPVELKDLPMP